MEPMTFQFPVGGSKGRTIRKLMGLAKYKKNIRARENEKKFKQAN